MVLRSNVAMSAQQKVWGFLIDLKQMGHCVPGVEQIEIIEVNKHETCSL